MINLRFALFVSFVLATLNYHPSTARAQGSLTPPGPPTPTMKSLDQIEPRTSISSVPFTINAGGSYYLTKNLSVTTGDAITINADRVTLNLEGFTVSSTASPAGGNGVLLSGTRNNITILNGFIAGGVAQSGENYGGPGFLNGIFSSGTPTNVRVSGVSVSGCLNYGISLATFNSTLVESCLTTVTGGNGILAGTVSHCRVDQCGGTAGITADLVSNSFARVSGNSAIAINASSMVNDSFGQSSNGGGATGTGISAQFAPVTNCSGTGDTGIRALVATNCYGSGNTSPGISASTATNCRGFSSQRGISADVVTGCTGYSNGGSFGINAAFIASTSYGRSQSGTGLAAYIAVACRGDNDLGPSVLYTYHYNMPP